MPNDNTNVTSGVLLTEAVAVFKRNWPLLLIAGAVSALVQVGQNMEDREKLAGLAGVILVTLITMLASIGIQGVLARIVFVREEIVEPDVPARFGAFIGVSIVVLLGTMLGMLLLIVPGIMLALRWTLAANFTLTRDMGVGAALRASSGATEGLRGEIFGAYVVWGLALYGPAIFLAIISGGMDTINSLDPTSVLGAIRTAWAVFSGMAGSALGIGIFSVLVGRHGHLSEVFA
jgi:hypothetical protein